MKEEAAREITGEKYARAAMYIVHNTEARIFGNIVLVVTVLYTYVNFNSVVVEFK